MAGVYRLLEQHGAGERLVQSLEYVDAITAEPGSESIKSIPVEEALYL